MQGKPSPLENLLQFTIQQHGLFNTKPPKAYEGMQLPAYQAPQLPQSAAIPTPVVSNESYDKIKAGVEKRAGRDAFNSRLVNTVKDVASYIPFAVDHFIPEQKIQQPQMRPLEAYNPNPYGTGTQALYKNGGEIEDPKKPGPVYFNSAANSDLRGAFSGQLSNYRKPTSAQVKQNIIETGIARQNNSGSIGKPKIKDEVQKANDIAKAEAYWQDAGYHTDSKGNRTEPKFLTKAADQLAPVEKVAGDLAEGAMWLDGAMLARKGVGLLGKQAVNELEHLAVNQTEASKPLLERLKKPAKLLKDQLKYEINEFPIKQSIDLQLGENAIKKQYSSTEAKRRMANYSFTEDWIKSNDLKAKLSGNPNILLGNQGIYYNELGVYNSAGETIQNPLKGQAFINSARGSVNDRKSTTIHELTHQLTDGNAKIPYNLSKDLQSGFLKSDEAAQKLIDFHGTNSPGQVDLGMADYNYYTSPTEIHARINEIRHALYPKDPYKHIGNKEVNEIYHAAVNGKLEDNIKRMFGYLNDWDKFANTMNKVPAAVPAIGATAAAAAGNKNKQYADGGALPEDIMATETEGPGPRVNLPGKYGNYVKGREAWVDWTSKKLGDSTIKDMTLKAAASTKLKPSLLYASAMEEGMNLRVKDPDRVSDAYYNAKVSNQYPVDGFLNYGLDTFSDAYPKLVEKGYLKDDFKNSFAPYQALNEKKQKVNTAAFRDDSSALQAKAAMIAYTRDNMLGYAKKSNIELSPEAQDFFTLAAYNGGEGLGQKMLQSYNKKGVLRDNQFLKTKPASYPGVYDNVMHRIQGANMLTGEKVFEMDNGGAIKDPIEYPLRGGKGEQVKNYKRKPSGQLDPITYLNEYYNSPQFKERFLNTSGNTPEMYHEQMNYIEKTAKNNKVHITEEATPYGSRAVVPGESSLNKEELSMGVPKNTTVLLDNAQAVAWNNNLRHKGYMDLENSVLPHEYAHTARKLNDVENYIITQGNNTELNHQKLEDYFIKTYLEKKGDIKNFNRYLDKFYYSHDYKPEENYADLQSLRYLMYKHGIYDTRNGNLDEKTLQKALGHPDIKDDMSVKRLLKMYKQKDLINMNNRVAYQPSGDEVTKAEDGLNIGGGDPAPTRRLTPAEMQQWNQYLDYVKSKGLQGSKDLDVKDKNLGENLFNEFKQSNPGVSIDYSIVPSIQNEFQLLQQSAQGFDKRRGKQSAAYNNISKNDNWFGSLTSQQYFPSMELQTFKDGKLMNVQNQGLVNGSLNPTGSVARPRRGKPQYGDVGAVELEDGTLVWKDDKMRNGGRMNKKCADGYKLLEGQTYELSHEQIKELLAQGYQLTFE